MVGEAVRQSYSRQEVRRWLKLTERQLRSWEKQGLAPKAERYSFADLIALRTLAALRAGRVPPGKIRQAVAALRAKLGEQANPLVQLKLYSEGKQVRVQIGRQTMEPVTGQLLLDFDAAELRRLVTFPTDARDTPAGRAARATAERLFEEALRLEQEGAREEAIHTYGKVLEANPHHAGALLNLGTIYFHARDLARARDFYERAVAADPGYALARFNLANVFDELGRPMEALVQYQEALRLEPRYADAHYNIALLYEATGQWMRAVRHWRMYLKLDPGSAWSAVARRRLEELYRVAVVETGEPGA